MDCFPGLKKIPRKGAKLASGEEVNLYSIMKLVGYSVELFQPLLTSL